MKRISRDVTTDILLYFIMSILIVVGYIMTLEQLENIGTAEFSVYSFLKSAFVYITPCGLDICQMVIRRSRVNDLIEFSTMVISLILSGCLIIIVIINNNFLPLALVQLLLLVYPVRYLVNFIFSVFTAIGAIWKENRRGI